MHWHVTFFGNKCGASVKDILNFWSFWSYQAHFGSCGFFFFRSTCNGTLQILKTNKYDVLKVHCKCCSSWNLQGSISWGCAPAVITRQRASVQYEPTRHRKRWSKTSRWCSSSSMCMHAVYVAKAPSWLCDQQWWHIGPSYTYTAGEKWCTKYGVLCL